MAISKSSAASSKPSASKTVTIAVPKSGTIGSQNLSDYDVKTVKSSTILSNPSTSSKNAVSAAGGSSKQVAQAQADPSNDSKDYLSPVITSADAKNDIAAKQSAFSEWQRNNEIQSATLAQQKMAEDANKAAKEKAVLDQKNIQAGIDQKNQELAAKNAALGLATPAKNNAPIAQNEAQAAMSYAPQTPATQQGAQPSFNQAPNQISQGSFASGLEANASNYQKDLTAIDSAKESLTNAVLGKLNSVLKGTFPLSKPQQALISSMQEQLAQNVKDQTLANSAYTGSVAQAAFRSGGEYTPEQYAGQVAQAVSYGVSKIQALDNSAAITMANLEQDFQKQDYDMITKNYDVLSKQLDEKAGHVKDMYESVTSTLKAQNDAQRQSEKDVYDRVTKPVQDLAEEAAKNGASQETLDRMRSASSVGEALSAAGHYIGLLDRQKLAFDQSMDTQRLNISKANLAISQAELKLKQSSQGSEGTLDGKPQNVSQSAANSYANRLNGAEVLLAGTGDKFASPYAVGGSLPNILQSSDRQVFEQAKSNFATAVLRRESGAAISPSEFATLDKAYFPQAGDSKEVLKNKEDLRNTVINNFYREANVPRPVLPGMTIVSEGKKYKVDVDGETLIEVK